LGSTEEGGGIVMKRCTFKYAEHQVAAGAEVVEIKRKRKAETAARDAGCKASIVGGAAAIEQERLDLVRSERAEPDGLTAGTDRREKRVGTCGNEDNIRGRRGLLERFEQGIRGLFIHPVGVVDNKKATCR